MRWPETILVIGGRGGIGSALSEQLHDLGHQVIVTSRQPARPVGGVSVRQIQLNLESPTLRADLLAIAGQYPEISTVIHCAGRNTLAGSSDLGDDELERMMTVNLRSAMTVGAVFGDQFRAKGEGTLLFVGSMLGQIGMPGYSAYCATKFGLNGYAEALRRELHHHGVDVLTVSPRATRTAMNSDRANQLNDQLGNQQDNPEKVAAAIVSAWSQSRARTNLGWPERFFAWLNKNLPFLVDRALSRQAVTVETHLMSGGPQS